MLQIFEDIQIFIESGGQVLIAIGIVTFLMWILILERISHYWLVRPTEERDLIRAWEERTDKNSWNAKQIRQMSISMAQQNLRRGISMIQTLVALCPLLGLLGTVTGMIEVFDVMAAVGSGNARAMASGVSKATIPTMSGMVAALSGLYFISRLDKNAKDAEFRLAQRLGFDEGE